MNKKEVAIFGGAFDPPTKAHEGIIEACLERPDIDEVWLMPSGLRTDKPNMSANAARLAMLGLVKEAVFGNDERLVVSDFEQRLPQPTQTHKTIQALNRQHPDHKFWYVYGADAYHMMPTWEYGEEIRRSIGMLLVGRHGYELPVEDETVRHLAAPAFHHTMSSTSFREALKANQPVHTLVGQAILRYINEQALYVPDNNPAARI